MHKLEDMRSIFSKSSLSLISSNPQKTEIKTRTTPLKAFSKSSEISFLKHCLITPERPKHIENVFLFKYREPQGLDQGPLVKDLYQFPFRHAVKVYLHKIPPSIRRERSSDDYIEGKIPQLLKIPFTVMIVSCFKVLKMLFVLLSESRLMRDIMHLLRKRK